MSISLFLSLAGPLKTGRDQNMLTVFLVRPVESNHEINAHLLELAVLPLRMARLQGQAAALAQASFSNFYQAAASKKGFANPGGLQHQVQRQPLPVRNIQTFQTFPGFQQAPPPPQHASSLPVPSCPQTFRVLATIRSCYKDTGISRQEIYSAHVAEMTQRQVDERVDYLTSEGHIYTTSDLDHFKSTDS